MERSQKRGSAKVAEKSATATRAPQTKRQNKLVESQVHAYRKQKYTFNSTFGAFHIINQRLPNPDRVLQKRGQSLLVYRELLSDAHLTAALESRESATLSYDWRIERGDCPSRLHKAIEKWFFSIMERKMCIEDLSRDELTANLLDVIYWGHQPAELTWDYMYGMWLPVQITPKPPEWFGWFINDKGIPEIRFLSLANPVDGEVPPDPWTLICPRIKPTYDNPYGRGVASRCFWPIVFKRAGMEFWLNFMERFGTPWVMGKIDGAADETVLTSFANDLKVLVQDAVIAVAGNRTVEILESKNQKGSNDGFKTLCDFMDSQMSKTILGHTLSTDSGEKASYAATKGALTVRNDIQKRDITMVRSIWSDIVNLIMMRNGYIDVPRPRVVPYHADEVEVERATRDEALSRTGVKFNKSYFIRTYHLEEDDIDEIADPSKLQATGTENKINEKDKPLLDVKKESQKGGAE
jgi:phage gp29-like protein